MKRLLAVCVLAACSSSTPSTKTTNGSGSVAVQKDDAAMAQDSVSIYPADALLAWLEQHKDQVVKLPVLVTIKPNRMNVGAATVGDAADALAIKAADNTMAVPIAGKWGQFCPSGDTCMLELTGVWVGGDLKKFQVRDVIRAIPEGERAQATTAALAK